MATINIYSGSSNWIEATLSNLAHTPFVIDDEQIASFEEFYQGIKYPDLEKRRSIFKLFGVKAKGAGREANQIASGFVYWGDGDSLREIVWQSEEYYQFYYLALFAKFTQDDKAQAALLATGDALFLHNIPSGKRMSFEQFQETHFCQFLYDIREFLLEEQE